MLKTLFCVVFVLVCSYTLDSHKFTTYYSFKASCKVIVQNFVVNLDLFVYPPMVTLFVQIFFLQPHVSCWENFLSYKNKQKLKETQGKYLLKM